jgi:hypothetical protein
MDDLQQDTRQLNQNIDRLEAKNSATSISLYSKSDQVI